MPRSSTEKPPSAEASSAGLLMFGGMAAAFGVASCCALPILLTTAGFSAAWLGGVAEVSLPHRTALLWFGALSLLAGAIMLWRIQYRAATCGPDGVCTPPAIRLLLLVGLAAGATLLWLGYSYV